MLTEKCDECGYAAKSSKFNFLGVSSLNKNGEPVIIEMVVSGDKWLCDLCIMEHMRDIISANLPIEIDKRKK